MTTEEYKNLCKKLKDNYHESLTNLMKKFCDSNNTIAVNDIIEDHIGKIKVLKIGYCLIDERPEYLYLGIELNMDGTPRKKESQRTIWQSNLKKF